MFAEGEEFLGILWCYRSLVFYVQTQIWNGLVFGLFHHGHRVTLSVYYCDCLPILWTMTAYLLVIRFWGRFSTFCLVLRGECLVYVVWMEYGSVVWMKYMNKRNINDILEKMSVKNEHRHRTLTKNNTELFDSEV